MRFGKPIKNKRRNNPRYFTLTEGIKIENNSNRNMHDVQFHLEGFYPFCKQALGFEKDATVVFESDFKNANNPLGKTAYYDPTSNSISVYVDKRHPKDILRSVAHELVHHHQNLRGDLDGASMEEGYAQNDDHLREMEREAYEKGNMLFRDWEDHKKSNNGDESLMARIMEKWGYDAAALHEDSQTFKEGDLVKVVASALAVDGEKNGTVVSFEDPAVTIKLDDDQEGKHVPENKMVKVKKDYVEPRAEAGFAPEMGASEDETLGEDMYDGDDFDMGTLEDEFPWLAQDVSSGDVPAELAAELAAEFGDKPEPEEEEELTVMKEGDFVGHHVEIDGKTYVDSNFLNSVRKIRDTFPSEMKSMGFGEFYLETPKGRIDFDRSRGKTFPGAVGRGHLLRSDPPELADELLDAMEQAGASETPLPTEEPPLGLEEIVRGALRTALKETQWGGFTGGAAPLDSEPLPGGDMPYEEQLQLFSMMVDGGDIDPKELLYHPENIQNDLSFPDLTEDDVEDILDKLGRPELADPSWQQQITGRAAVQEAEGGDQNIEIVGSLVHQHGFMNARESLEQAGFKVDFVTSPLAMYMLEKDGVKYAALNKKHAEDPELVVGDIAIGTLNEEMSKKDFVRSVKDKGKVPNLKGDMGPLPGMEGPFQYKSGAVLYYDTKTGEYYDRGKDMYLDREEAARLTMENKKMNLEDCEKHAKAGAKVDEGFLDRLSKFNKKQETGVEDKRNKLKDIDKKNKEIHGTNEGEPEVYYQPQFDQKLADSGKLASYEVFASKEVAQKAFPYHDINEYSPQNPSGIGSPTFVDDQFPSIQYQEANEGGEGVGKEKEEDESDEKVDESDNKEWYDSNLFESLMQKWAK